MTYLYCRLEIRIIIINKLKHTKMKTQKFFKVLGESLFRSVMFLLIPNAIMAWIHGVNYFNAWEHSIFFSIGFFIGTFCCKFFAAEKD